MFSVLGGGEFIALHSTLSIMQPIIPLSGGGKGSDEEHITYSGGKEIFDLLRCGWGERKDEKKKTENMIK